MTQYWMVGAMWGGHEDQSEVFIRRGYWFLGWSDEEQPTQAALRDKILPGDRIAIKRMLGQGSPNIEVRALGTVKEIDHDDKRVWRSCSVFCCTSLLDALGNGKLQGY